MDFDSFLEEKLVAEKGVAEDKLEKVKEGVGEDDTFPDLVVTQKLADEDEVLEYFTHFYGLPAINLNHYEVDENVVKLIPSPLAQKFSILPLFKIRNVLMLAMVNPSDIHIMDEIRIKTTLGVEPVVALPSSIKSAIYRSYDLEDAATDIMDGITDEEIGITEKVEVEDEASGINDEPIVKLVNLFITQAINQGASDLHLNPEEKQLRVRFRVDGVLHEIATPPKKLEAAIISRVKVLANLDIAEKRKPQDGRIKMKIQKKKIDLRVSSLPTIFGENIVMRILDSSAVLLGLDQVGFSKKDLQTFSQVIRKPYGIILVTGPTGSGKTTTLYSALGTINSVDKNIITLEDPVEYNLNMIRQGQVNHKVGFDFAAGLRAILRQDPDVIMVGEIRDGETASIAIEAALTGHLVFTTLHTNDSVGAIARLEDMGIELFLISSAVLAIIAQRLLRKICTNCKEEFTPTEESLKEVGAALEPGIKFYRGKGCGQCMNTGYKGRLGIYEILLITPAMKEAILKNVGAEDLKKLAIKEGTMFLRQDGVEKAKQGITTIEEVLRVTKEE